MTPTTSDENLLFGVLAYRNGLINSEKLDYTCRLSAARRAPIEKILEERRWIDDAKRRELQEELKRLLAEHAGNARSALNAAMDSGASEVLKRIAHPHVRDAVAALHGPKEPISQSLSPAKTNGVASLHVPLLKGEMLPVKRLPRKRWLKRWPRMGRYVRPALKALAVLVALAALIVPPFLLYREHRGRIAAESTLAVSLDAHSAEVRRLVEGTMPLQERQSSLRRKMLERKRDLFQQIVSAADDSVSGRMSWGVARTGLARIALAIGPSGDGVRLATEAVNGLESVNRQLEENPDAAARLADAALVLGRAHAADGHHEEAVKWLGKSAGLYERLLDEHRSEYEYHRGLAHALVELGEQYRATWKWRESTDPYVRARPVLEQMAQARPGDLNTDYRLALALRGLYSAFNNVGYGRPAAQVLDKCTKLARKLAAEHPNVPECQQVWIRVLWALGLTQLTQVEARDRLAVDGAMVAWGNSPFAPNFGSIIARELVRARGRVKQQAARQAKAALTQGLELAERVAKMDPGTKSNGEVLAHLRVMMAQYEAIVGDPRDAISSLDKALAAGPREGMVLFNAADVYARCGARPNPMVPPEEFEKLKEHCAKQVVEVLREAREKGYPYSLGSFSGDGDWLMSRDDFKKLDQVKPKG